MSTAWKVQLKVKIPFGAVVMESLCELPVLSACAPTSAEQY